MAITVKIDIISATVVTTTRTSPNEFAGGVVTDVVWAGDGVAVAAGVAEGLGVEVGIGVWVPVGEGVEVDDVGGGDDVCAEVTVKELLVPA